MKHSEFLKWKAQIVNLSDEQRAQAMSSLKMLGVKEATEEQAVETDWFTKGLFIAMQKNMGFTKQEEYRLLKSKIYKEYLPRVPEITKTLNTLIDKESNTRSSLAYLAGLALIKWCTLVPEGRDWFKEDGNWKQRPITPERIIQRAHQVMRALDYQFPGYIQANMFGMVFESLQPKRSKKNV